MCTTCNVPVTLQHYLGGCNTYKAQRDTYLTPLHQSISKIHFLQENEEASQAAENYLCQICHLKSLYSHNFPVYIIK